MKFVTPLNRVLGLGSAKGGVGHWWIQRLSAVALVPLGLWLALSLPRLDLVSYPAVVAWVREPITGILLVLTSAVAIYHSYLGVQVIVEDYVHAKGAKLLVLVTSALTHTFLGVACVFSVLRVGFGAA